MLTATRLGSSPLDATCDSTGCRVSNSTAIYDLQNALNRFADAMGFPTLDADGAVGKNTAAAYDAVASAVNTGSFQASNVAVTLPYFQESIGTLSEWKSIAAQAAEIAANLNSIADALPSLPDVVITPQDVTQSGGKETFTPSSGGGRKVSPVALIKGGSLSSGSNIPTWVWYVGGVALFGLAVVLYKKHLEMQE